MCQGALVAMRRHLGLQYLQFLDMGAGSGPPDGTHVVHHGTDELLIQQNTISDGKTASVI